MSPRAEIPLGLYVHVPFCARACDFCNFYQERPDRAAIQRYLDGVRRELASLPPPRPATTVFWGGGTPGLLAAEDLFTLGKHLREHLPQPPVEWTVEMAPGSVRADKLAALRELGVNRISMGVQSFDDDLLDRLGRPHSRRQIETALARVVEAGFPRWNLDLMFALPGQSLAAWESDLREAMNRRPSHISTYCLTFEEDTALWVRLRKGQVERRSEAEESAFYECGWDLLEEGGYGQYEVSNFAPQGHECLHNLNTWRMAEWLGYGPSASSQFGENRWTNAHDLDVWLGGLESGAPARMDEVQLDPALLAQDSLVFGLRMNAGVDLKGLRARYPEAPWTAFANLRDQLESEGLAESCGDRWRLTRSGRLLADAIGAALFRAMDDSTSGDPKRPLEVEQFGNLHGVEGRAL